MYDLYIMRRTQIYLDEEQGARLGELAAEAGVTVSSLIREAIDGFRGSGRGAEEMSELRAAVAEAAGCAPGLPPGADYVDELRPDYGDRRRALWER